MKIEENRSIIWFYEQFLELLGIHQTQ